MEKLTIKQKRAKLKRLKNKATKLLRQRCLERDKSICQRCKKRVESKNAHMSHVKSKGAYKHMAWDLENVKILCYRDHMLWWHKEPTEAGEWFKETFPKRWEYLQARMRETPKVNIEFLEKRIAELNDS